LPATTSTGWSVMLSQLAAPSGLRIARARACSSACTIGSATRTLMPGPHSSRSSSRSKGSATPARNAVATTKSQPVGA
jgi:hypothetical protein